MSQVGFDYKDKIKIKNTVINFPTFGSVYGKIKDKEAYVVSLHTGGEIKEQTLRNKLGYPNRHLELDWGSFTGSSKEFIVAADVLEKRQ